MTLWWETPLSYLAHIKLQRRFFVADLQQMCELKEVCIVKRVYTTLR